MTKDYPKSIGIHRPYYNKYGTVCFPEGYCKEMNRREDLECECHWQQPFGFCIMSGCNIHDN